MMTLSILCLASLFTHSVSAGSVTLKADTALSVERGGVTIARASGPGLLTLGDFPAGDTTLRIVRDGMPPLETRLTIPTQGPTLLRLEGETLLSEEGPEQMTDAPAPILVMRPAKEQSFSIVIDDVQRFELSSEHVLDSLSAGSHQVEVRSLDNLTIWARGQLTLTPGAAVVVDLEEGRAPRVTGVEDAWQPTTGPKRTGPE